MPSVTISKTVNVSANAYAAAPATETASTLTEIQSTALAVAKIGQLTTRGSNTAGTLTMTTGHGFTTGVRLDIYWVGGVRRGVTVGTVSVDSVPFTLGAGDNLPDNLTAVVAMIPAAYVLTFTGDNCKFADGSNPTVARVSFVFTQSDSTLIFGVTINTGLSATGDCWSWNYSSGTTNPFAGVTNGKVYMSHDSTTVTQTPLANALYS